MATAVNYSDTSNRGKRFHRRRVPMLVKMSKINLHVWFHVDARLDEPPRAISICTFKKHDKIKRRRFGLNRDKNLECLRWRAVNYSNTNDRGRRSHWRRVAILVKMSKSSFRILFQVAVANAVVKPKRGSFILSCFLNEQMIVALGR